MRSWDGFLIPYPFSKGVYLLGDPIVVPPDSDEAQFEACRLALEEALNALTKRAEGFWCRP